MTDVKGAPTSSDASSRDRNRRYAGLAVAYLRSRLVTRRPFFLAHSATYACNSRCKTCNLWKESPLAYRDLKTEEVFQLLSEAYEAGMRGYYMFGGEPLLRRDVEEILAYAKAMGYVTTLNTNASLLKEKAQDLAHCLDFIFVSVDAADGMHDDIRGRRGSFKEALDGVLAVLEAHATKVTLVTTISRLNIDRIEEMAALAQKIGVGISYNAVEPVVRLVEEEDTSKTVQTYGLNDEQLRYFYWKLLDLKRQGYPLMESTCVLKDYARGRGFRCDFPKIFVYVSPEGLIFPCTPRYGNHPPFDLRGASFKEYFESESYRRHVALAETCTQCLRTCVRMYSYSYYPNPLHYATLLGSVRTLIQNHPRGLPIFQEDLLAPTMGLRKLP